MIIDGDKIFFRQSWLDTAQRCPEEGRLATAFPDMSTTTDEAIIGTGAHWAIEQVINGAVDRRNIGDEAVRFFAEVNTETFRFTKRASLEEVIDLSARCAEAWERDLMDRFDLDGAVTEAKFSTMLFNHRGFDVGIQGTVDLASSDGTLSDWKTSAKDYNQKQKQMWATQPTIYAIAATEGAIRSDVDYRYPLTFRYGVMVKLKNKCRGQIVEVQRTERHASLAMERMRTWVDMYIDMGVEKSWPLIDEGNWLCSPRWCDFYDMCRGSHISKQDDLFGYSPNPGPQPVKVA